MKLTEYYAQREARFNAIAQELGSELTTGRASLKLNKADSESWINRTARLDAELQSAEAALAGFETGADIAELAERIRGLSIDRRTALGRLEIAQLATAESAAQISTLARELESVNAIVHDATDSLDQALKDEESLQGVVDAVGVDPLASVPTHADALLSGAISDAIDRLNAKTSAEFMALVLSRTEKLWQQQADLAARIDELQTAADTFSVTRFGSGAGIESARREFESAKSELLVFHANAEAVAAAADSRAQKVLDGEILNSAQQARFNELLAEGDVVADVLTPESNYLEAEHNLLLRQRQLATARALVKSADPDISETDLNSHADVAAILDGSDGTDSLGVMQSAFDNAAAAIGIALYDDVLQREQELEDAKTAFDDAVQQFLVDNPEGDPDTEPSLSSARTAVTDATTALESAQATMQASPWYRLEQLETAIPDGAWRDILSLLQSRRDLTGLKDIVPATLVANMTSAEDALATAIAGAEEQGQGADVLRLEIEQFSTTATLTGNRSDELAFSAVRGQG
jgi:hypothetical protein